METKLYDLKIEKEHALRHAAEVIRQGGLVVFPTETVYGLGADAENPEAVKKIFAAKGRPQDNPLIVHIGDIRDVTKVAREISESAWRMMEAFWPGPFSAVLPAQPQIPKIVTGGLETVAVRMPETSTARELIQLSGRLIAAPSANLSGRPSPTKAEHVVKDLWGKVDIILDGGECSVGLESTVCDLTGETPIVLRPGGITPEMIQAIAGNVEISHAVLNGLGEKEKAASPGMKYKHYSPKACVFVAQGKNAEDIAKKICLRYDRDMIKGKKSLIICAAEQAPLYRGKETLALGEGGVVGVANRLFDALRLADEQKADTVYFHAVEAEGLGLAVMNRVIRAAAFKII